MSNPLLTADDVMSRMDLTLTSAQQLRLADMIDEMYYFLQSYTNRLFYPADIVDEKHEIPGEYQTVSYLFKGPVNYINYIRIGSITAASTTAFNDSLFYQTWPGQSLVYVSYNAGGDSANDLDMLPVVKNLIRRTAIKVVMQGDQFFTGLSSYAVEGVSASFNTTPNYHIKTADLFEGKELEGLDRWVRPVVV